MTLLEKNYSINNEPNTTIKIELCFDNKLYYMVINKYTKELHDGYSTTEFIPSDGISASLLKADRKNKENLKKASDLFCEFTSAILKNFLEKNSINSKDIKEVL